MCTISVIREGEGPEILLVHGGASPEATGGALAPLRTRWTLASVHRRGYPPSPPPLDERQDFDVDAADILPLLGSHPHVLAHSYGVLGVLIAAGQTPENVRSLTLIEPPLYYLVSGDPEIERLERIGDAVLAEGLDADPETLRAFLRIAAAPGVDDGPLPERWRAAFVAHGAVAFPARLVQRWTQFAKPPSHRWSPRGTTHRASSASAMPWPQLSTPSGWSQRARDISSPPRRVHRAARALSSRKRVTSWKLVRGKRRRRASRQQGTWARHPHRRHRVR